MIFRSRQIFFFFFLAYGCPVAPTPFVENAIFPSLTCFCTDFLFCWPSLIHHPGWEWGGTSELGWRQKSRLPHLPLLVGTGPVVSVMSVWSREVIDKCFLSCWTAPFLGFGQREWAFWWSFYCLHLLVFLGCWFLHLPVWDYMRQKGNSLPCPSVGPKVPSLLVLLFQSQFIFVLHTSPGFLVVLNGEIREMYIQFIFLEEEIPSIVFLKNIITTF